MTDLAGWTIVSDDDNGSILVQSPQGHRRRIWRDETEEENATLLAKVNKQQEEIERLNAELVTCAEMNGNLVDESTEIMKQNNEQATEIERLRVEADKLLLTLEITTIERDKAREVARACYARIRPHNIPDMPKGAYDEWCSVLLQRHPWLEEK